MKLTRVYRLGRYHNATTGQTVNIHKGVSGAGWDVYFYLLRGKRQLIGASDMSAQWKRLPIEVNSL